MLLSTLEPEHTFFDTCYYPTAQVKFIMGWTNHQILREVPGFRACTNATLRAQQQVESQRIQTQISTLTNQVSQMRIAEEKAKSESPRQTD